MGAGCEEGGFLLYLCGGDHSTFPITVVKHVAISMGRESLKEAAKVLSASGVE
jgi:hypothetical protein